MTNGDSERTDQCLASISMGNGMRSNNSPKPAEVGVQDTRSGGLTPRSDLDMKRQRCLVADFHQMRRYESHMADWRKTMASCEDHAIMVQILITEAHRQNPKCWPRERCLSVLKYVRLAMSSPEAFGQPQGSDAYASVLHELSRLRLFDVDGASSGA